jgi:hypothetical protein
MLPHFDYQSVGVVLLSTQQTNGIMNERIKNT